MVYECMNNPCRHNLNVRKKKKGNREHVALAASQLLTFLQYRIARDYAGTETEALTLAARLVPLLLARLASVSAVLDASVLCAAREG